MSKGITRTKREISDKLEGLLDRSKSLRSFLDRNIYPMYQNVQRTRWMTENASEGAKWDKLDDAYARRKKVLFRSYEGAGTKMLIATGRLYKSVIGPGEGFRKVITEKQLIISTTVDYARHVDAKRSFSTYSPATWERFNKAIANFVFQNRLDEVMRKT